jgi:hypothetical protein
VMVQDDGHCWTGSVVDSYWAHPPDQITDARPLIILDIEDTVDAAKGLRAVANAARHVCEWDVVDIIADQIEAQTRPPRIPEPGLWGVVEAGGGFDDTRTHWIHIPARPDELHWASLPGQVFEWNRLIDPVLIRDGISE